VASVLAVGTQATLGHALPLESEDVGFEQLFVDSLDEVYPEQCTSPAGLPQFLDGTYVTQSTSQYSMGGRTLNSWLDAYYKLHVVQFQNGQLCYKTKLIRTGYYNKSVAKHTVAGGVLFLETTPPRECFFGGLCNIKGPNDNNFAVSYRMRDADGGFRYALMTDTNVHLDFDVQSLTVVGTRKFEDHFAKFLHMQQGGGTHLQCEAGKGTSASDCNGDLFGVVFEQGKDSIVDLYRLRAGRPDVRELIAHVPVAHTPGSLHSFGITDDVAIIPSQPFEIDASSMLLKGLDIMHSVKDTGNVTPIYLVDLHNGSVKQVSFPAPIFYVHIVNSWQNSTHFVFDASVFERQPFTLDDPAMVLAVLRNKTARDAADNTQTIRRYAIDRATDGVTEEPLTHGPSLIDFPKVAPSRYGHPYCVYYGVEWKHNGLEYGSWAVRKHNLCTGEVAFYHKPSSYLSEPVFVPGHGADEDDGVVLTIRTNGLTGQSDYLVLDAKTMAVISEATLPHQVGWFAHGAYYPNIPGSVVV
jgi:carotenoid cleavage dioxygenase-like enzyme